MFSCRWSDYSKTVERIVKSLSLLTERWYKWVEDGVLFVSWQSLVKRIGKEKIR